MAGSVGQPFHPPVPLPRSGYELPGVATDSPAHVVQKQLQPPWPTGSRLAMRDSIVPQSVVCSSTWRPARLSWSCTTWLIAMICGRSDGAGMTMRSPL